MSFNQVPNLANATFVSESQDGGLTWGPITVIRRDTDPNVFNDKESITADYTDARFVYAIWDRLVFPPERAGGPPRSSTQPPSADQRGSPARRIAAPPGSRRDRSSIPGPTIRRSGTRSSSCPTAT